ncbi:MAG: SDR family NAD(P)-dependent oxidoreductase, partial [Steroidobacteraceae bacterium]
MPTILITGTSRGLGLECVRQYAEAGWAVLACARNPRGSSQLQALASTHPKQVQVLSLDVENHNAIDQLARELDGTAIDVLLNSAGTMGNGSFAKEGLAFGSFGRSDYKDWESVFR